MSSTEAFNTAADKVKTLKSEPSNDEKLQLYGLFKQATVGDVNTDRPGLFDPKGKAKWDAWEKVKGKSKEDAEKEYTDVANTLIEKYGLQ